MAVQPDRKYEAAVLLSMVAQSKGKGTPCVYFKFRTEDGRIEHQMYLTEKTAENVAKTMRECFGIERKDLGELLRNNTIGAATKGRELSITTESKTYEDRHGNKQRQVIVKWMNPVTLPVDTAGARALEFAGRLFGGAPVKQETGGGYGAVDDDFPPEDDVPY